MTTEASQPIVNGSGHLPDACSMPSSTDTLIEKVEPVNAESHAKAKGLIATQHTDAQALFDALSSTYSSTYTTNEAQRSSIQKLISMLPVGSRVLDVGCGDGIPTSSMLSKADLLVTGVDISPNMIAAARKHVPRATFQKCDMRNYHPGDLRYDAVVSIFSTFNMPTNAIREMAFKMAHWLKPGGLLLLGTIDFVDVPRADGHDEDPYGEWLNHEFMGQVIKDNAFGVGEWIELLRSADVSLVEANGSVFAAVDGGIALEPEVFVIGRKGEAEALFGPYPRLSSTCHQVQKLSLTGIEKKAVLKHEDALKSLNVTDAGQWWALSDPNACLESIGVHQENGGPPLNGNHPNSLHSASLRNIIGPLARKSGQPQTLAFLFPAPYNDVQGIINHVAASLGLPPLSYGNLLHEVKRSLRDHGYNHFSIRPIDGEYVRLTSDSPTMMEEITSLLGSAFEGAGFDEEVLLKQSVQRYISSQRHLGGRDDRIGFQRVVFVAQASC